MTELRTERLVLRRPTPEDLPTVLDIQCDPATHQHDRSGVPTRERATELMESMFAHWAEHGFGYCMVELAETGEVIGLGGVRRNSWDEERSLNLFYRFRPSHWGRGYASEMARAVIEWAEATLPELPVVIATDPDNAPSIRLAERLGFRQTGTHDFGYGPEPVFRRSEPLVRGQS